MLNSHPKIINPGECDFLFDKIGDHGELPDTATYIEWLLTNRIFQAKRLNLDKSLTCTDLIQSFVTQMRSADAVLSMNVHRHFHRIPYVFPDARYIHLLRDPRDVARSCVGMGWAGNVYHGVDIWIDAEQSWHQLRKVLSLNQFLEIKYEDIVNDIEAGLGAICKFLSLPYSDLMLSYTSNSTYTPPDKSLCYQWKKKYTPRELQIVNGKLGAQLVQLGYELGEHGAAIPSPWERLCLFLQNKKFRVIHQIRRYGIRLYIESLISSRIGSSHWKVACQRKRNEIDIAYLK